MPLEPEDGPLVAALERAVAEAGSLGAGPEEALHEALRALGYEAE